MKNFNKSTDLPEYPQQENLKYVKVEGSYTWVIREDYNPSTIHVQTSDTEGYDGRVLKFELTNGSVLEMKGPWHSNADAFFKDTGVDVRDNHLTFTVVARRRGNTTKRLDGSYDYYNQVLEDVLYQDESWTIGSFDRGEEIAQRIANELGENVQYYKVSRGGSSLRMVKPNNKEA